jgi:hypothetical protein
LRTRLALLIAGVLTIGSSSPLLGAEGWELITNEDGIRVFKREVAGTSLVEFLGRGQIKASMIKISAVVRNPNRGREWMESCSESRIIRWRSPIHAIIYNRLQSPIFLVSDRDMVVEAQTTVDPRRHAIRVDFRNVVDAHTPEIEGAQRVPKIIGHWELVYVDDATTEVEYQVFADPGGSLPGFLVNWASQSVPFHTIEKLRRQVLKDGYDTDIAILERAIDWDALIPGSPADDVTLKAGR